MEAKWLLMTYQIWQQRDNYWRLGVEVCQIQKQGKTVIDLKVSCVIHINTHKNTRTVTILQTARPTLSPFRILHSFPMCPGIFLPFQMPDLSWKPVLLPAVDCLSVTYNIQCIHAVMIRSFAQQPPHPHPHPYAHTLCHRIQSSPTK